MDYNTKLSKQKVKAKLIWVHSEQNVLGAVKLNYSWRWKTRPKVLVACHRSVSWQQQNHRINHRKLGSCQCLYRNKIKRCKSDGSSRHNEFRSEHGSHTKGFHKSWQHQKMPHPASQPFFTKLTIFVQVMLTQTNANRTQWRPSLR